MSRADGIIWLLKFAKDFEGCTLTELLYDEDVENRFAEAFDTNEKAGDSGSPISDRGKCSARMHSDSVWNMSVSLTRIMHQVHGRSI